MYLHIIHHKRVSFILNHMYNNNIRFLIPKKHLSFLNEKIYVNGKRAATLLVPVSITFYLSEFYIKYNSFRFIRVSFIELLIFYIELRLIIRWLHPIVLWKTLRKIYRLSNWLINYLWIDDLNWYLLLVLLIFKIILTIN